jgi:YVTN family beta-propeller protein
MRRLLRALLAVALVATACNRPTSALPRYIAPPLSAPAGHDPTPAAGDVYAHTRVGDVAAALVDLPARVYVPNSSSDTVDVIDPTTYAIVDHFSVGKQPQHVTPSWDMTTLYVDNDKSGSLTPIDVRTGKPGPPIPVPDPYNLYFTPDGSKAVVVAEALQRLDFRDPKTWQLLKSVPIGHRGIDHADFSADGRTMVVSCEFSGWIVRVDVESMTQTGELDVGGQPIDVKLSPDGTHYFVANQKRGGVSIVDASTFEEQAFVPTGAGAHGLYGSRDGQQLYVSNRKAGSVSVLDFHTGRELKTFDIGGSPDMGGVSADGKQLWLSGRYDRAVYVIDTETGLLLHKIDVGNGPHGLALFPQPGRYSLGHTGVYR